MEEKESNHKTAEKNRLYDEQRGLGSEAGPGHNSQKSSPVELTSDSRNKLQDVMSHLVMRRCPRVNCQEKIVPPCDEQLPADNYGNLTDACKSEEEDGGKKESKEQKLIGGMFLTGVAGMAMLGGFARTLTTEKKKDPTTFTQSMIGSKALPESGVALASRALMWGTVYAVGGFSAFCFLVWKLMGVHSMEEFRNKIQNTMPKIPKKEQQGRSDFKTVRELVNYIIEEDEKNKTRKK